MMGRWAYRRLTGTLLTIATLTVAVAVAGMTIYAPGQAAGTALATIQDSAGAQAATASLTGVLETVGLDPAVAPEAAAAVVNDPALADALANAQESGDTTALPGVIAAAVAPYSGAASADITRKVAELLKQAEAKGITDPSSIGELDLSSVALPSASPGAVDAGVAASSPFPPMPAAGPRALAGDPGAWVGAHREMLTTGGALAASLGLGLLLIFARARRAQTLRLAGRWALVMGGLPLLALYVVVPLVRRLTLAPSVELALVAGPKLLAPATLLWAVLLGAGLAAIAAAHFVGLWSRPRFTQAARKERTSRAGTEGNATAALSREAYGTPEQAQPLLR